MWRVKLFLVSGFFFLVCVVGEGDKAQEFWSSGGTSVINVLFVTLSESLTILTSFFVVVFMCEFFIFLFLSLLKSNWFTMLCYFLLYSQVTQWHIHMFFSYSSLIWFITGYWMWPCCLSIVMIVNMIHHVPQTDSYFLRPNLDRCVRSNCCVEL